MKNRSFLIISIVVAFLLLYSVYSSGLAKDIPLKISNQMLWEGREICITEILRIGSDDFNRENYIFGSISDIAIDEAGNIFVLDSINSRIQQYSSDGTYVRTIGKGKGAGPGEFLRPRSISLDGHGNIYVADMNSLRITKFDPKGGVVATIKTIIQPIEMAIGDDSDVFVTGAFDVGNYKIYKYSGSDGKLEKTFCKEINKKSEALLIANIGGTGRLYISKEGYIYFSFFYPYLIQKYNQNGDLIAQFSRKVPFYKLPNLDRSGKIKDVLTGSHEMAALPTGMLIHVIKNIDIANHKVNIYFDLFDKEGNWLTSFSHKSFNSEWRGKVLSVDSEGSLYLDFWEPFPHIRKFKLTFPENSQ